MNPPPPTLRTILMDKLKILLPGRIYQTLKHALPAEGFTICLSELTRKIHVPLSYADALYDWRLHLTPIREQAEKARGQTP